MQLCEIPQERQTPYIQPLIKANITPAPSHLLPTIPPATVEADTAKGKETLIHSDDYRSVKHGNTEYSLTKTQALIVKRLFEYQQKGITTVHQDTLLEDMEIYSKRIRDVFKGSTAWRELVIPFGKGFFCLSTST